jgi:hypothetical protein
MLNEVCELVTPLPETATSYFPGVSPVGSFSVRVHSPALAANELDDEFFFAPCLRMAIVSVVLIGDVPVSTIEPTSLLAL